jgi:acetyl/propionyl-CoA carboxylase alpha subunit
VDAGSPAVSAADIKIEIEGVTPAAAYLDGAQIIRKAIANGVAAIHPGYGFLSENSKFAQAVIDAGMVFIGPAPETIELMGDKIRARAFVATHGLPIPPSAIEDDDPNTFEERARAIGTPLVIKPAAGGGGKGMRIVRDLSNFAEELERAHSESLRLFGDRRVYAERYIEQPRHIEVQILGDSQGNIVHLFERECSIQRRFQKVVEESPSPALSESGRAEICEVAVEIARRARYRNAGTVEFIWSEGQFYFLEMNTRIQVEHPVTEEITGIDLIAEQIRIAAGEALGYNQSGIGRTGHAIELRVYAEDPSQEFSPTTGKLLAYRPPPDVRIDGGVASGDRITTAFDPMIAKLITHGADRMQAIERARAALREFVILGCTTNVQFLRQLLDNSDFVEGNVHTHFVEDNPVLTREYASSKTDDLTSLGLAALRMRPVRDAADEIPALHAAIGQWRN